MNWYPSLTSRLATQHQAVWFIISTTDTVRLLLRPEPGKWNIHDNIAHLARYQPVFTSRMEQILQMEGPAFGRYVAGEDPEFRHYQAMHTGDLVTKIEADRQNLYHFIINLPVKDLNRTGTHKKYG